MKYIILVLMLICLCSCAITKPIQVSFCTCKQPKTSLNSGIDEIGMAIYNKKTGKTLYFPQVCRVCGKPIGSQVCIPKENYIKINNGIQKIIDLSKPQ